MPGLTVDSSPSRSSETSNAFYSPFRALGYITNHVPICIQQRGQTFAITTCIGSSFQIYDGEKLNLLFVGAQTESPIAAMTCHKDFTFVAVGSNVLIYSRGKEIGRLEPLDGETASGDVVELHIFGHILLALCDDNVIRMWNHGSRTYHNTLGLDQGTSFTATHLIHPATYLNKILVASQQGSMQLWNIRSMKLIYEFKSFGSPVTCLAQAPSVDIIAIGLLNGTIILYDIKADEELMRLQQDGKVTAITFRTDGKQALMATASMQGQIALWDLDSRQLFHVMMTAHDAAIQSCAFYTNQPIMVTASEDNSLKMWIFDSLDGLPRLLKLRSGHYKPPTKVRYYGDDGKTLVTAGQDQTLRHFSMIRDAQNVEFSQGSIEKKSKDLQVSVSELKAPVITSFDTCTTRAKEWDNILTSHFQSNQAHTWSTRRKAKGSYTFVPKDASSVKSTALSACGHFGFIGSALGTVDKFNLQSGIHRGSFKGHTKAVVAIATDNTNRVLVTGSLDKTVKFWDFSTGALLESMTLDACIEYMVYHRDNNLLVIVTDDLCIRVLDTETKTIVREFWGHEARITDVAFSFDGRWLVSSSLDSTIRTWDLPTSYLIDVFQVEAVPTSVAFSPTGDFLVSTHVGKLGVFVWANRSLYETMPVRNLGVEAEVRKAALPLASGEAPLAVEEESKDAVMVPVTSVSAVDWENISDNLITLSSVAKAKWQNLLSLDAIKKRNKPKEAPKAPEKAPFFLSTLPGVDPKFVSQNPESTNSETESSRVLKMSALKTVTKFGVSLNECGKTGEYTSFLTLLKSLSPSAADFEIRSLSMDNDWEEGTYFLEALVFSLEKKRDFELVQAYLSVFLKIYGDMILSGEISESMIEALRTLQGLTKECWTGLEERLNFSLCLIDFARW